MNIAICSDEPYPLHEEIVSYVESLGHKVHRYGSLQNGEENDWAQSAHEAAQALVDGQCDEGVFFCWTGTGITIAANKVRGIRAALCTDPETARGARIWNHANVIGLSNRLMTKERAIEILDAWFSTRDEKGQGQAGVDSLLAIENKNCR